MTSICIWTRRGIGLAQRRMTAPPTTAYTQISGIDLNLTRYDKKWSEGVIFLKITRSAMLLEFTMVSFLHLFLLVLLYEFGSM